MNESLPMDQVEGIPQLDTSLLPAYQLCKQQNESWIPDFDVWSYLNLRADLDLAVAFTQLFWPRFIEVENYILLKHNYSQKTFAQWVKHYNGDRQAVESMVNHVHMKDLFLISSQGTEYSEYVYDYLAHALMFGWKQALSFAYPDRYFVFTIRHGYGPEISFHQANRDEESSVGAEDVRASPHP